MQENHIGRGGAAKENLWPHTSERRAIRPATLPSKTGVTEFLVGIKCRTGVGGTHRRRLQAGKGAEKPQLGRWSEAGVDSSGSKPELRHAG